MIRFVMAIGVVAWLAAAGAAHAQSNSARLLTGETGMSQDEIAAVFRDAGLPVAFGRNRSGGPTIGSSVDGVEFTLFGYGCEGVNRRCSEFMFQTIFDLSPPVTVTDINEYNASAIAGRAYLQDGGAYIEHFFSVTSASDAGIVKQNIATWRVVLKEFSDAMGFGLAAS